MSKTTWKPGTFLYPLPAVMVSCGNMEKSNITGHWTGIFNAKGDETEIDFTERVEAKKWLLKPFVKLYLKKQQAQFVADIRKALGGK